MPAAPGDALMLRLEGCDEGGCTAARHDVPLCLTHPGDGRALLLITRPARGPLCHGAPVSRRTTTRVTLVAASVLMVAVAPLVACTTPPTSAVRASEPAPVSTTPSGPVSPSPSDVPPPTPTWPPQMALPTPPPEMSRADETGAIAAATYFITKLYPYTYMSQDTAPLLATSHADCQFCAAVISNVAEEHAAGRSTHPGEMTVDAATSAVVNPLEYQITMDTSQTANTLWSSSGTLLGTDGPHTTTLAVFVVWASDRWILRGVDALRIDGTVQ